MIIINQMTLKNRLEEPDSWTDIDTLDSEQEIQDKQICFVQQFTSHGIISFFS